jgi:hypothetical protein
MAGTESFDEQYARLLLFGLEALPTTEQGLLQWLLTRPDRMSIAFEEVSALSRGGFLAMQDRWLRFGLLRITYSATHDANLAQATDFAAMVAGLIPVEPPFVFYTVPVDLDAWEMAA